MVTGLGPTSNLWNGARIGLLGGSFNPAHRGHFYISELALKKLGLDHVWWLVAPHNPLKKASDLAPYKKRLEDARKLAVHPRIHVLDFEEREGLHYTVDTLKYLYATCLKVRFAWLMGADCFAELPKWKDWQEIVEGVPIAVFARPGHSVEALTSKPARIYRDARLPVNRAKNLVMTNPPAWVYIEFQRQDVSGTALRGQAKG